MAATEVSYSAFLRGPSAVLPALERNDVRLERRGEEDLVLTRLRRYEATREATFLSGRVMQRLVKDHEDLAEHLLAAEIPWLVWMPESEQRDCLNELLANLVAGADTGTFEPFTRAMVEWRHTAEVWADPELADRLAGRFDVEGGSQEIDRPFPAET